MKRYYNLIFIVKIGESVDVSGLWITGGLFGSAKSMYRVIGTTDYMDIEYVSGPKVMGNHESVFREVMGNREITLKPRRGIGYSIFDNRQWALHRENQQKDDRDYFKSIAGR